MQVNRLMYPWLESIWPRLAKHPAHAILVDASDGWAIDQLALYWAQAQLCESPNADFSPCGTCESCHSVEVKSHADLGLLVPETYALANDWPLDSKVQDALDKKERKPSRVIKIDQVRQMLDFSQRTASRRGPKIIWIHPADTLTTESANALLKTLEEPVPGLRFILTSEHVEDLLPTIRSRCQRLNLEQAPDTLVLDWLNKRSREIRPSCTEQDIHAAWLASGGQPMRALRWLENEAFNANDWNRLPELVARGQGGWLALWGIADQLRILQMCAQDWLRSSSQAQPRFFAASAFACGLKPDFQRCIDWAHDLTREMSRIDHPLNAQVSLHAWLARSHSVFM